MPTGLGTAGTRELSEAPPQVASPGEQGLATPASSVRAHSQGQPRHPVPWCANVCHTQPVLAGLRGAQSPQSSAACKPGPSGMPLGWSRSWGGRVRGSRRVTFLPVASDGLQSLLLLLPGSGWQQLSNCCFIFFNASTADLASPCTPALYSRRTKSMVYYLDFLLDCWGFFLL